ncbi:MAG TPA: Mut7-C RNAse domain-containing protein [Methanospirillum sp.]|nr:Mut7-C RNAse domain-containing protein [Methanospirillum sp.]
MDDEKRFLCDRMAGSLCRYLRLMGYDTLSANDMQPGNPAEDTILLKMAIHEDRILLTRDAELSRRNALVVLYLESESLEGQIIQLVGRQLIIPVIRLTRCSLCNSQLIEYKPGEGGEDHISDEITTISWCPFCKKAYWEGSHTSAMRNHLARIMKGFTLSSAQDGASDLQG